MNSLAQQDKHLSMWNENASMINPAAAGVMEEDMRFLTNFRLQWLTLNGTALRTNTFSFDAKLFKNKAKGSNMGIGLNFTNDQTGDVRLTSNVVSVPISYNIAADKQTFVSLGVAPGFYSQSLGTGNQTWDNQWDTISGGFDLTDPSGESFQATASSFDIGAGIQVKHKFDQNSHINVGFGVNHITAPKMGYTDLNMSMYRNMNFYVTASKFNPVRRFGYSPQVLVSLYGPNTNILFGSYFDHELFESSQRTDYVQRSLLSYGFFYRWKDALVVSAAYKFSGLKLGVSYDFNISKLTSATRSSGGLEFFLKYSMMTDRSAYIHDRKMFRWKGGRGRL
jgi:type IX secretion system PorP/SprF family membrane protein